MFISFLSFEAYSLILVAFGFALGWFVKGRDQGK